MARLPCADCFKSQSERAVGAGRGRTSVTGRWNGLLKQMTRLPCADCFKSQSERAVGAGRGRTSVTGRWDGLLKQTARVPHADCFRSLSECRLVPGPVARFAALAANLGPAPATILARGHTSRRVRYQQLMQFTWRF